MSISHIKLIRKTIKSLDNKIKIIENQIKLLDYKLAGLSYKQEKSKLFYDIKKQQNNLFSIRHELLTELVTLNEKEIKCLEQALGKIRKKNK